MSMHNCLIVIVVSFTVHSVVSFLAKELNPRITSSTVHTQLSEHRDERAGGEISPDVDPPDIRPYEK